MLCLDVGQHVDRSGRAVSLVVMSCARALSWSIVLRAVLVSAGCARIVVACRVPAVSLRAWPLESQQDGLCVWVSMISGAV